MSHAKALERKVMNKSPPNKNNVFEQELTEETENQKPSVLSVPSCSDCISLYSLRLRAFACGSLSIAYRSSSAAMMLMLPSTATTSLS